MSSQLVGTLDRAGDIYLGGYPSASPEPASGLFIRMDREALRDAKSLPMFQRVAVLPVADLAALRSDIDRLRAARDMWEKEYRKIYDTSVSLCARVAELTRS